MRITESTLRKIIREELDAVVGEADVQIGAMAGDLDPEFTSRLNRASKATKMILRRAGMAEKNLSPVQMEVLPNLAARVAARELSLDAAVKELRDAKRPMEEVIKKGELDRNQLRAQRQIHAAIQNMHKRNPKRARRIIDYLEGEVPPKYMTAIKNVALGNVRAVDAARALLDLAKSAVPPKKSMEEAAHEPAGELVHRANPNFRVFKTVKGAGPTYGGVKGGYRSKTLSKVGEFELYRGDESLGVFTSLPAAKKRIAALSARRR